jgi:hypothetical protein
MTSARRSFFSLGFRGVGPEPFVWVGTPFERGKRSLRVAVGWMMGVGGSGINSYGAPREGPRSRAGSKQ